jgi:hypothetical protein
METVQVFRGWALDPCISPTGRSDQPGKHPLYQTRDDGLAIVRPYGLDWPAHGLGSGSTGGGKTLTIRVGTIDLLAQPGERIIALADGKGRGTWTMFRGQPGILGPASGQDQVYELVRTLHTETMVRLDAYGHATEHAYATRGMPNFTPPPPIYFILDEYMHWILRLGRDQQKAVAKMLLEMTSVSREVGICVELWMQRPDASTMDAGLPGPVKQLLECRTAVPGSMGFDGTEAKMLFDTTKYAARMPGKPRSGLMKMGLHVARFQTPWVPDACSPDPGISLTARRKVWAMLPGGQSAYVPIAPGDNPAAPAPPPVPAGASDDLAMLEEMWRRSAYGETA